MAFVYDEDSEVRDGRGGVIWALGDALDQTFSPKQDNPDLYELFERLEERLSQDC